MFIMVATVFSLFPKTTPAYARNTVDAGVGSPIVAQTTGDIDPCDLIPIPPGVNCTNFPPPELLYLRSDIYFATAAQTASLHNLENEAVQGVLKLHSLPPTDEAAVRTWGRDAVLAELYVLLVKAINTDAAERTADQQNAVDWVAAIAQRQSYDAAYNAAREYVKWAGLGRGNFEALMRTNPSKAQIEAFLSGPVVNYDFPAGNAPGISTEGWCVYRSPAPYESEYTGFNNPLCSGPVLGFVLPPTPSYDQFVKWGEAKARYSLLSSPAYLNRSQTLGVGLGVTFPVIVAVASAAPVSVALRAVAREAAIASIDDALSRATTTSVSRANIFSVASRFSIVAGATVALTVITALVTAVLLGINVTDAATLPGKLATLVDTARTTTPDVSSLIGSTDAGTNLFSIFVGSTTPMPRLDSCDNSNLIPGFLTFTIVGTDEERLSPNTPCLNPTRIPTAAATDPQFLVKNASGVETLAPTIAVRDNASGTVTTARLNNTWFITSANGTTAQTLRLAYTGWDGTQQSAWLTGTPTDGYTFLTMALDSSATTSAVNCLDDGTCGIDSTLKYIGADGQQYSATVRGYQAPTGTPTFSAANEGSPVVFDAGGFAPGGAVQPVTYRWSFKDNNCALVFGDCTPTELASFTDATFTYTWDTGGTYRVDLTATDAIGAQATTTLQVPVASLPPAFVFAPDCATSPNVPCNNWSGNQGSSVAVLGTLRYTGSASRFTVSVDWGDATTSFATIGSDGSVGTVPPGGISTITVTKIPGELAYQIRVPYTYANRGVYNGTVRVQKLVGLFGDGGTVTLPFTLNVRSNQTISFSTVGGTSYGNVFPISATGGASGQPVTFTTNSTCRLSDVSGGAGVGSATVTVVSAGECVITARQAGSATYNPAPDVTRRIISLLAPLTITAPSPTITYGEAIPALTPSYDGFRLSDDESILTTPATCVVASNSGGLGSYATSCSGAIAPNYSTDYVPGTLTITKAPLTITANNKTMVYGQAVPSFDASIVGLAGGDTASVISGLSCDARDAGGQPISSSTPIGSYPITCSGGSAANYSLSYVGGTLTIDKATTTTTLSASPASSLLGQAVTFTASITVDSPGSGTPGGTVTFLDNGAPIAGCAAQPLDLVSGTATCTTAALSLGRHTIGARYSGDANFISNAPVNISYRVNYGFSGFSGPVENPPKVNTANAGRNIPLKWRVTDAAGNPITNLSSVSVTSVAGGCSAGAPSDGVEEYVPTASGLQNQGNGYYQFNWKTEKSWAGTCRTLQLNLGDGRIHTAIFQFR
jgi:hypothetical protein